MAAPARSLRFPIAVDRFRGRFTEEPDYAAHVDQLVRQVLLTNPGERVNRPDFGSGLLQLIFAPNSPELAATVQFTLQAALQTWLGDVIEVKDLTVAATDSSLTVDIVYTIRRTSEEQQATFSRAV